MISLPATGAELEAEQSRIARIETQPWVPGDSAPVVGACFTAFARGIEGEGAAGDPAWVASVALRGNRIIDSQISRDGARAPYSPGHLFLRAGPLILRSLERLAKTPDVILLDATGQDHPRQAGLALHIGHLLDIPTIGVTDRPLMASYDPPPAATGATTALLLDGRLVGHALRARKDAKPLVVHAGWRTSPQVALEVVQANLSGFRTPEPLRRARQLARWARGRGQRRTRTSHGPGTPS